MMAEKLRDSATVGGRYKHASNVLELTITWRGHKHGERFVAGVGGPGRWTSELVQVNIVF